jgi:hypothetical protein
MKIIVSSTYVRGRGKKIKHRAALCTHVVENGMPEMRLKKKIHVADILHWKIIAICKIEALIFGLNSKFFEKLL